MDAEVGAAVAAGSPKTYHLLVTDRGWHAGQYQQWLTLTLEQTLLPQAKPR